MLHRELFVGILKLNDAQLTLERKSPVTRLDINSPGFGAYKSTFPGLYKTLDEAIAETPQK